MAKKSAEQVLKQTVLRTLLSAVALPVGLLEMTSMIDGPWTLAIERADEAGVELAQSLLESKAGHRPVSIIGFSFGARIIYSCLKELARHQAIWEEQQEEDSSGRRPPSQRRTSSVKKGPRQDVTSYAREPASIVEDAILMGCPAPATSSSWRERRRVVGGRFVNCYHPGDMMLLLMYRLKHVQGILKPSAGTVPVNAAGVHNYNVADHIEWHSDYCFASCDILRTVGYGEPRLFLHDATGEEFRSTTLSNRGQGAATQKV